MCKRQLIFAFALSVGLNAGSALSQNEQISSVPLPAAAGAGGTQDVGVVRRVNPDYPGRALERGIEGWVIVGATVDPDGNAYDFRVLESEPTGYFESAALKAFQEWQFSPATRNG